MGPRERTARMAGLHLPTAPGNSETCQAHDLHSKSAASMWSQEKMLKKEGSWQSRSNVMQETSACPGTGSNVTGQQATQEPA
eukprot:14360035-Heterocapsa_arctica.AAC.1